MDTDNRPELDLLELEDEFRKNNAFVDVRTTLASLLEGAEDGKRSIDRSIGRIFTSIATFVLHHAGAIYDSSMKQKILLENLERTKVQLKGTKSSYHRLLHLHHDLINAEHLLTADETISKFNHTIRNALVVIGGSTHALLRHTDDNNIHHKYLSIILEEVEKLERFLAAAKEGLKPGKPRMHKVDLVRIIDHIVEMMEEDFRDGQIVLKKQYDCHPCWVWADEDQVGQVIFNVLRNFCHAMDRACGYLTLRLFSREKGAHVEIEAGVKNHCIEGENSEQHNSLKLFGTIGLMISHQIVENHGGTIVFDEMNDDTYIFNISIPFNKRSPDV
jgi:signal transduction histidine kinase